MREDINEQYVGDRISVSKLLGMFADSGLEVEDVSTDHLRQQVERWLTNARTRAEFQQ